MAAVVILSCSLTPRSQAVLTPAQMRSLPGATLLGASARQLLERCGLPAAILDLAGANEKKRKLAWRGTNMTLSPADWRLLYGNPAGHTKGKAAWTGTNTTDGPCLAGVAGLDILAKGRVGTLITVPRSQGWGYDTHYRVPENLHDAHKVVRIRATLPDKRTAAGIAACNAPPDAIVQEPGGTVVHRHWVLTHRERRPDTLHAVDFVFRPGASECDSYVISATGTDLVDLRFDELLRQWERNELTD